MIIIICVGLLIGIMPGGYSQMDCKQYLASTLKEICKKKIEIPANKTGKRTGSKEKRYE
jgi:hypothetical protein